MTKKHETDNKTHYIPSCTQMHIVVAVAVALVVVVVITVVIILLLERSTHQCFCSLLKYFAPRQNTGPVLTRRYDMCPTADTTGNS